MTGRQLFVAGVVLLCATTYLQGVSADTVIVEVDPTGQRTKVLEDWNDGTDNYASLHNVTSGGESDGVGNFSTAAGAFDPQFHYSETYDPVAFPWVRMRRQGSAGITELFPLSPASATTRIVFGTNPAELAEARKAFVNTDNITTPNGFRIDPTGANAGTFGYDYLMIDAFETIGAGEWDENDGTDGFQGWSFSGAIDGGSVANSLLSGTGNGDAYMWRNVIFDPDKFKYVEIRMRASGSDGARFFWGQTGFHSSRAVTLGVNDGAFHTYLLNFADESTWTGSNMNLRLDPVTTVGETFDVDYIRVMVVPEPSSLALAIAGMAGLGLLIWRRRNK